MSFCVLLLVITHMRVNFKDAPDGSKFQTEIQYANEDRLVLFITSFGWCWGFWVRLFCFTLGVSKKKTRGSWIIYNSFGIDSKFCSFIKFVKLMNWGWVRSDSKNKKVLGTQFESINFKIRKFVFVIRELNAIHVFCYSRVDYPGFGPNKNLYFWQVIYLY
jgi:hypothetical protein